MKFRKSNQSYCEFQEFSPMVPEYAWNPKTETVELVGEINQQEKIQSFEDCALEKVLQKFLSIDQMIETFGEKSVYHDNQVVDGDQKTDFLEDYLELQDNLSYLHDTYGITGDMSYNDMIAIIKNKNQEVEASEKRAQVESSSESEKLSSDGNENT